MTIRNVLERILAVNPDLYTDGPELLTVLEDGLAEALFGDGASVGDSGAVARDLLNLYENCKEWTGDDCAVETIRVEGVGVELGEGAYMAFEELDTGEVFPVLGYDMKEDGRVYFHRLPEGARVFVLRTGAIVVAHPDLVLTAGGIDEGESAAPDIHEADAVFVRWLRRVDLKLHQMYGLDHTAVVEGDETAARAAWRVLWERGDTEDEAIGVMEDDVEEAADDGEGGDEDEGDDL